MSAVLKMLHGEEMPSTLQDHVLDKTTITTEALSPIDCNTAHFKSSDVTKINSVIDSTASFEYEIKLRR